MPVNSAQGRRRKAPSGFPELEREDRELRRTSDILKGRFRCLRHRRPARASAVGPNEASILMRVRIRRSTRFSAGMNGVFVPETSAHFAIALSVERAVVEDLADLATSSWSDNSVRGPRLVPSGHTATLRRA